MQLPNRFITILGHGVFLVLLVLATIFYKERLAYSDMALYIYQIIETKSTLIAHGRFIDIIPQFFVVIAVKNCFALKWVLLIYSWSLVLFPYIIFIYCWHILRSQVFSIVILMVSIGFYTHAFYACSSELQLGMQASVLLWATLYERKRLSNLSILEIAVVFGVIPFIVFSHPLALFPSVFAVVFFFLNRAQIGFENKFFYALVLLLALAFVFKIQFMPAEVYEANAGKLALENLRQNWYKAFTVATTRYMFKYFFSCYYLLPLLPVCFSYYYIKNKNWIKLLFVLGTTWGLFSLIQVSNPNEVQLGYIENFYAIIAFCLALPLAIDYLPNLKIPKMWVMAILTTVCMLRITNIALAHRIYTERINWITAILHKHQYDDHARFMVNLADVPEVFAKKMLNWGISYESLLLSALEAPARAATIYTDSDPHRLDWAMDKYGTIILQFDVVQHTDLNQNYFKVPYGRYMILKGEAVK